MELDRDNMQDMLAFIQQQNTSVPEMSVQELLRKLAKKPMILSWMFTTAWHRSGKVIDNSQLNP